MNQAARQRIRRMTILGGILLIAGAAAALTGALDGGGGPGGSRAAVVATRLGTVAAGMALAILFVVYVVRRR
jgi:hypothetical protein